ncbi:MAG: hypothetical protein H6832_16960 [Planctomycetes bacterium]|nr:hypothetical protein [Planctomycetota bacterium]MCB9890684.1 hypothetical protein [Planctomycetota bacterium]MCB9920093.1 hypothetical protein [Planctomycetota bacterium]
MPIHGEMLQARETAIASAASAALVFSLALAVFTRGTRAQSTIVVPQAYATAEGGSFTSLPFGRSTAVRVQQGYGSALFPNGKMDIARIAWRADGARDIPAKGLDLEIGIGSVASSATLAATFAQNRGLDYAIAFTRRVITLPAITNAPGPRAFQIEFVLDRPFRFDPSTTGLLIELIVHSQQAGRYEVDLDASCTSARADFGKPGCTGSNQLVPLADCPTTSLVPGGGFTLRISSLRPQDLALGFLGTIESGTWQGLVLPAALDGLGGTGCTLNTDITVAVGGSASSLGELRLPGTVPPVPNLVGAWLRFQGLAIDRAANALGMSFSNGHKVQVCGLPPMARVVATNVTATSGTVEIGLVPITRFTY